MGGEDVIQEREFTRGLTTREAEKRIQTYGYNELKHKKNKSAILIFLSQFNDFIVWVLIVATVISGIMGDKADAVTILIIVFVNAILGFVQEFKTEKSLEALQELAAPTCKVIRDGSLKVITSRELTLSDVVVVEAGDRIPADGKFIDASNMVVDESLLTGESVGVSKDTTKDKNHGYMGTIILKGRGMILIDAIGMNTEMGKIANLLDNIEEERSPLKERLNSLGKILVIACLVICAVVTILGIIRGNDITEMFLLGVSLAVAAIPEGLAAIVTVALALGVNRMLKRNALVRRLPAVETLGCTSVICSDKTGTLTQNKMTVKEIFINGRIYELDRELPSNYEMLKKAFVYCNDTNYDYNVSKVEKALMGDPTETALISAFFKDVKEMKNFVEKAKRVYDIPFDSTRKMMTVIMKEDNCETCYMKGAPERVINKCNYILENGRVKPMTMAKKKQICSYIDIMSNKALRCIAAAYKKEDIKKSEDVENNLIFIGVAGSMDPPRPEVKEAVMKCKLAGIKPVMITGDHKNTALAIAKSINICNSDDQGLSGEELEKISDDESTEETIDTSTSTTSPLEDFTVINNNQKSLIYSANLINEEKFIALVTSLFFYYAQKEERNNALALLRFLSLRDSDIPLSLLSFTCLLKLACGAVKPKGNRDEQDDVSDVDAPSSRVLDSLIKLMRVWLNDETKERFLSHTLRTDLTDLVISTGAILCDH